ncbi:MAG: D-alanine--D-alanine ligase family protein [Caldisericaceae bacterium]
MKERVLVIDGGLSNEREISLRSGRAIFNSLKGQGFEALEFDFRGSIEPIIEQFKPDVVFIALHGIPGEDGTVQGMLEIANVAYTFSGVLQSSLCMNKLFTKLVFRQIGIKTPNFISLRRGDSLTFEKASEELNSPKVVVKPVDQGSAIGVGIVDNEAGFNDAIREAFKLSSKIIIEEFIKGTEITVTVIGNYPNIKVLPIIEIIPTHSFYDFYSKYTPGKSTHRIPAKISAKAYKKAEEFAFSIYKDFELRDLARIDMIVDNEDVFVLEVNTIPGFTETSLVPDSARAAGLSFDELTSFIVGEALSRRK